MTDIPDEVVERVASSFHDAYELAAVKHGWQTNVKTRLPFEMLPPANAATMLEATRAALHAYREAMMEREPTVKQTASGIIVSTKDGAWELIGDKWEPLSAHKDIRKLGESHD